MSQDKGSTSAPQQTRPAGGRPSTQPTVIGETCRLTGDLVLEGDAVILGTIEGQVEITGRLEIGRSGVVKGSIRAATAELSGQVHGDAICEGEFHIAASGTLLGNIYARGFAVENGATCRGHCVISQHALEAADEAGEYAGAIGRSTTLDGDESPSTIGRIATSGNADDEGDVETNRSSVAGLMRRRSSLLQNTGGNRAVSSA